MTAHPVPHTRRPHAHPIAGQPGTLRRIAACSALILWALTGTPSRALAQDTVPSQKPAPSQAAKKTQGSTAAGAAAASNKAASPKPARKPASTTTGKNASAPAAGETDKKDSGSAKTRSKRAATTAGKKAKGSVPAKPRPLATPSKSSRDRIAAFEHSPGVLGASLLTLRREQLKDFVTEPVGLVALGLEDLRLSPVNKRTHVEVNLAGKVPFEGKGDKVGAKAARTLDPIGRLLAENPQTQIKILVHTDDQGDADNNLRQSQRAADAVKEYLVRHGVAATRLTAIGRGEEAPLAATGKRPPNQKERDRDRRVELIIEPLGEPAQTIPTVSPPQGSPVEIQPPAPPSAQ